VLTVDDLDVILRRGFTEGDFSVRAAALELNLEPAVQSSCERYADWIANNVCDGVFNGFRGIKAVILVGGGAVLVGDKLRQIYGNFNPAAPAKGGKILDPKKHPLTKKVHPVDMNAVGGLRYALSQERHRR
jgi:hypothetical protein